MNVFSTKRTGDSGGDGNFEWRGAARPRFLMHRLCNLPMLRSKHKPPVPNMKNKSRTFCSPLTKVRTASAATTAQRLFLFPETIRSVLLNIEERMSVFFFGVISPTYLMTFFFSARALRINYRVSSNKENETRTSVHSMLVSLGFW